MAKRTPLYDAHVAAGGKIVEFGGWDMPLNYGSQIKEHEAVRTDAGVFDVSHMTIIDVRGDRAMHYLQKMVANNVGKLKETGRALYGALLNERGGVVDDLIVYRRDDGYRCVVNASTRDKVWAWLNQHIEEGVALHERDDLAMLAVQGPSAVRRVEAITGVSLSGVDSFSAVEDGDLMLGRTGYTGEDGVELMLPNERAEALWQQLLDDGVAPIGLAARDTLRLEAGLNLYGQDMTEDTHPYESNIGWTISMKPAERQFIGRAALEGVRAAGVQHKLTGLVLNAKGVMRHGYIVRTEHGDGEITSGIFSPTLGYSIALARVPTDATGEVEVEIRGKAVPARLVKPPFVRDGQSKIDGEQG